MKESSLFFVPDESMRSLAADAGGIVVSGGLLGWGGWTKEKRETRREFVGRAVEEEEEGRRTGLSLGFSSDLGT